MIMLIRTTPRAQRSFLRVEYCLSLNPNSFPIQSAKSYKGECLRTKIATYQGSCIPNCQYDSHSTKAIWSRGQSQRDRPSSRPLSIVYSLASSRCKEVSTNPTADQHNTPMKNAHTMTVFHSVEDLQEDRLDLIRILEKGISLNNRREQIASSA